MSALWNEPADHVADFEAFHLYCDRDVLTECAADRRMMPLRQECQEAYWRNERINDRGIRVDVESAKAALLLVQRAKAVLDREMREVTGGAVTGCSKVEDIKAFCRERVNDKDRFDSLAKAEIEDMLEDDTLQPEIRRVLELRQEYAKTSTAKIQAFLNRAGRDGRIRGSFLFRAAGTGRYSSTGAQVHNLPRPRKVFGDADLDPATLFAAIRTADPAYLRFLYGDDLGKPLWLVSDAIRGFLWAAPGHDLIAADYSGIEGAVAAWVAGEQWKVKALFDLIADPKLPDMYRRAAAGIFNTTVDLLDKKDPRRQVGKVAELSCLGAGTQVLTRRGAVAIVDVRLDDELWDGIEWVKHSGVVANGVRPVVDVDGIDVTPDHLMLAGPTWKPAGQLASRASTLYQALETGSASLRSLGFEPARPAVYSPSASSVPAARPNTRRRWGTLEQVARHAVRIARRRDAQRPVRATSATTMSWPTRATATACSAVSQPLSTAAPTRTTKATPTTEAAAFGCSGAATDVRSLSTSSRSQAGTTRRSNWTAARSTETTRPETSGSSRARSIKATGGRSPISKPVFDILNSGPRNRFLVFSTSGALIVHNCQYQGGVGAFRAMARNYSLKLKTVYAPTWEAADPERREKAQSRYEECRARNELLTQQLCREEWLAAELVKVGWRATHPAIVAAWKALEAAARGAVDAPGSQCSAVKCTFLVARGFLWCRLPSGRCLAYGRPQVREVEVPWADKALTPDLREKRPVVTALGVDSQTKQWVRYPLYGGLLFENVVQAIALDLLDNGLALAEEAGYPVVGHVHDEIIAEVPRGFGDVGAFERLICQLPAWAQGLPLTAGGWRGKRYRKD